MEPRPSHPIPIWLGAFGPRALAVTGRLADGWIPSLGYLPTGEFPAMRRRIDAAAEAAGRRPAEIRGVLNLSISVDPDTRPQPDIVTGSVKQVTSQLHELLDYGFTGFNFLISGPDRTAGMRRIAEDVLPALRSGT
jgi:alkanesulfonate monooxygenase SsuD/methylene tetrahydromethanopterin reductase-like flavin-dependent oxidoreductase (luciferase family)